MKQIKLHGRFIYAQVDDSDFEFLNKFRWHYAKSNQTAYAESYIDGKTIRMHTLVLPLTGEFEVDHKDENGLNNQRDNLRAANRSQNTAHGKKRKGTSSKYKGVSFHKHTGKWRARVGTKYLGVFDSEIAAARAYNKVALETYGEFAKLNEFGEPL